MIYIKPNKHDLENDIGGAGLEIRVDGFQANPQCPEEAQIFIEIYEGKLRVCVWKDEQDPEIIELVPKEYPPEPKYKKCETCGKKVNMNDKHSHVELHETNGRITLFCFECYGKRKQE